MLSGFELHPLSMPLIVSQLEIASALFSAGETRAEKAGARQEFFLGEAQLGPEVSTPGCV